MQRLLLESESGVSHSKKKLKRLNGDRPSDECSEDEDEDDEDSDDGRPARSRKKKVDRGGQQQQVKATDKSKASNSIHDLLQDFLQQQQRMESQWWEMMDRRTQEWRMLEQEWCQSMEKLERRRLMLEQEWREREDQRGEPGREKGPIAYTSVK